MNTETTPHFGVCIKNEGCDDLELRKFYQLLPDEAAEESELLRVIDESGEDYLYPAENFIRLPLSAAVKRVLAGLPVGTPARNPFSAPSSSGAGARSKARPAPLPAGRT